MKKIAPVAAMLVLVTAAAAARADTFKVPSAEHATIQSAVDSAGTGDTIVVAKGTYTEAVTVTGKVDLTIKGKTGAILQPGGGNTGFSVAGGSGLLIQGFVIDGPSTGILLDDAEDAEIRKVTVVSPVAAGISLLQCSTVRIRNSKVTNAGTYGVVDSSSTALTVEKCVFENCPSGALYLSLYAGGGGSAGATVSKNRFSGTGTAIFWGGTNAKIEKNRIDDVSGYGIMIDSSSGASNAVIEKNRVRSDNSSITVGGSGHIISKNRVDDSPGIIESGSSIVIERNTVVGANNGVVSYGNNTVIERNTIRMPLSQGIISYGTGVLLERNRVFDAPSTGISVQGTGAELLWNAVARPEGIGIQILQSGALLEGNRVSGAGNLGIFVGATSTTLLENRSTGSGQFDLADTNAEGVNMYSGNRFGTTQFSYGE